MFGALIVGACILGFSLHHRGGEALPAGSSRLVVYQRWVGHQFYTEGSRSYLRVTSSSGHSQTLAFTAANPKTPVFSKPLAPGRYTITSWQRTCDGNCDYLGPPTDTCHTTVNLPPGRSSSYDVELAPGHGCTIELRVHL
jgi:hypothetical protein